MAVESRSGFSGADHFVLVYGFHIHYIFAGRIKFQNMRYKDVIRSCD